MGKFTRFLFISVVISAVLSSCVDKKYEVLGDIDWTMGADMTIVGPAFHTKIKLYEPLPSEFGSFKFRVDGDEIYLSKSDTQKLGNDITGHLKMYPKGEFDNTIDVTVDVTGVGIISKIFEYEFADLNTNPNERLDSILYRDGQEFKLTIISPVPFAEGSKITFEGDDKGIGFDPERYPDNKIEYDISNGQTQIDIKVDMSRAMIRFGGQNKLRFKLTGKIYSTSPIKSGSQIRFHSSFVELKPRVTFGYLGSNRVIYETTKKIPFAYTEDVEGTDFFLPFYNPVIDLRGFNSIGIPAEYELDYVGLIYGPKGQRDTIFADFNGSRGTKFILNYPTPSEIEGLSRENLINFNTPSIEKLTQFRLDRDFGHTERLFQVRGDTLVYHYKIRPTEVQGENVAYFFDDSKIDVYTEAQMNMRFAGNTDPLCNFYVDRLDTLKVDFKGLSIEDSKVSLSDETVARFKLDFVNHLPVDGVCDYWLVDDKFNTILPSKAGTLNLNAAPVNNDGVVTADAAEVNAYIKLNYSEFKTLTNEGYAVMLKYKVSNKNMSNIWLKSNDWIDVAIEVWAKGFVAFAPSKKGGEE